MVTVSIIGTAGRKSDGSKLNPKIFVDMVKTALDTIKNVWKLEDVELVSGGAAYADHVAVKLFLEQKIKKLLKAFLTFDKVVQSFDCLCQKTTHNFVWCKDIKLKHY